MAITREVVRHIAELVRIELTESEELLFTNQLSAILDYMDKLKELDTATITPTFHPLEFELPLRTDEPGPTIPIAVVKALAPAMQGEFIEVNHVLIEPNRPGAENYAS